MDSKRYGKIFEMQALSNVLKKPPVQNESNYKNCRKFFISY